MVRISKKLSPRWGRGTCAIPSPREVDALMRRVRRGEVITINELRKAVAREHGATIGCPLTTGIFSWVAANAAAEGRAAGEKSTTPYWRTLKSGGELNSRYPGGLRAMVPRLRAEGHTVVQKGNRYFVADFEKVLARL